MTSRRMTVCIRSLANDGSAAISAAGCFARIHALACIRPLGRWLVETARKLSRACVPEGQLWSFVLRAAKLKVQNRPQTKTFMLGTLRSQNYTIYSSVASLSSSLPGVGSAFSRSAVDISAAACVRSCSVLARTVRVSVTSRLNYASPAARQSHVIEREKPLLVV